ncbi:gamma-glutamyl hydrolase 1-like [Lolium rigidum]|uniref:gamma-glutamyl hydrolase 1-like n=1 Tax=Lolium rigidum TaxID=89674 RepID=UPI001F5CEE9F|nr:gamma-glutamyl hydrolase 1-like [Lolium rigidum]XP_047094918.1 gamma-glutamyl hydrolase 1-like [Lolium rigidum]
MASPLQLLLLLASLAPSSSAGPAVIRLPRAGACAAPDPALYDRPVIGIVTHPGDGASGRIDNGTSTSYIGASYVKFVEAGGARVIPLIYNEPEETILQKLSLVNGVLFTGGSVKKGLYFETIKKVFQYVLEKNDAGIYFPLFAQCLGFELVSMIVSEDNNILESFHASDQASTLQFPNYSSLKGSVFERFHPDLIKKLSTSCLVMQNHKYGISPKRLRENGALSSFFRILTTSPDENGEVYVSTVDAQKYPITCTQWHPEKAIFEWRKPMIPHSEDAVQVTQNFANYFISQARKSPNRPPADKVLDNLIYNYSPTFSGKTSKSFEEVYLFS